VDHVYGLDDLRPLCFATGRSIPLYCEERVESRIRKAFDYAFTPGPPLGGGVPKVTFERITTTPLQLLGTHITPLRLRHGVFDVLGFRIGNVAYCTDTNGIPDETWPLLEGLDVLVLDCLRANRHPTHFSIDEALAAAAQVVDAPVSDLTVPRPVVVTLIEERVGCLGSRLMVASHLVKRAVYHDRPRCLICQVTLACVFSSTNSPAGASIGAACDRAGAAIARARAAAAMVACMRM
jgi:hypothetical protein